jgi:hypothetical protein
MNELFPTLERVEWQLTMPPLPGHKSVPIDEGHEQKQTEQV